MLGWAKRMLLHDKPQAPDDDSVAPERGSRFNSYALLSECLATRMAQS